MPDLFDLARHDMSRLLSLEERGGVDPLFEALSGDSPGRALRNFIKKNPAAARFLTHLLTTKEISAELVENSKDRRMLRELAARALKAFESRPDLLGDFVEQASEASGDTPDGGSEAKDADRDELLATCEVVTPYLKELSGRVLAGEDVTSDLERLEHLGEVFDKILMTLRLDADSLSAESEVGAQEKLALSALRNLRLQNAVLCQPARRARHQANGNRRNPWTEVEARGEVDLKKRQLWMEVTTWSFELPVLSWEGPAEELLKLGWLLVDACYQATEQAGRLRTEQADEAKRRTEEALRNIISLCDRLLDRLGRWEDTGSLEDVSVFEAHIEFRYVVNIRVLQVDVTLQKGDYNARAQWREDIDDQLRMVRALTSSLEEILTDVIVDALDEGPSVSMKRGLVVLKGKALDLQYLIEAN